MSWWRVVLKVLGLAGTVAETVDQVTTPPTKPPTKPKGGSS